MKVRVSRRDFINGVAVGAGALLSGPRLTTAAAETTPYYPPTRTGMRGNHPGSFEVSHAFAWRGEKPGGFQDRDERYDLVVVGAGISGLAAAKFYQDRVGPDARILILDNHDDFGGHAKRNEFHENGQMLLGVGGSVNLENPEDYSAVARRLLDELGINFAALRENIDGFAIMAGDTSLSIAGRDGHVSVPGKWSEFMLGLGDFESAIRSLPIVVAEQDKLVNLFDGRVDYLDGLTPEEQQGYVGSVSYAEFLRDKVGLDRETIEIFYPLPKLIYGPAGERVSVLEAFYLGCPGARSLPWLSELVDGLVTAITSPRQSSLYFPDGNASVARLLVRQLIPEVAPGSEGFADIATARFDYRALDRRDSPVRLRLNSTVVEVEEAAASGVQVNYVSNGEALSVTASHCILACYNAAIPYLCPSLPTRQKEALNYAVKVPLVLTNVVLKDGLAWSKLGVRSVSCPHDPYVVMTVAPPSTVGGHQPPRDDTDPMVVFLLGVPNVARNHDEDSRELCRLARHQVYSTAFETYERDIRRQLQGVLGKHGFNHETDIRAITVNRWPHGYAYEYMGLDDPSWPEGAAPHEIGRAQFGRISIANSDSEAYAYLDAAIDAAWRAVGEQVG